MSSYRVGSFPFIWYVFALVRTIAASRLIPVPSFAPLSSPQALVLLSLTHKRYIYIDSTLLIEIYCPLRVLNNTL